MQDSLSQYCGCNCQCINGTFQGNLEHRVTLSMPPSSAPTLDSFVGCYCKLHLYTFIQQIASSDFACKVFCRHFVFAIQPLSIHRMALNFDNGTLYTELAFAEIFYTHLACRISKPVRAVRLSSYQFLLQPCSYLDFILNVCAIHHLSL